MYIYVCLVIIILLSLIYLIVAKGIKNKKRIVLISTIALKNHKEYYGHKFYRFSSFKSETEVIKELRSNHYNAYYDQETGKVRITYDNDIFEIQMEKKENLLFINRYNYIFFPRNNS